MTTLIINWKSPNSPASGLPMARDILTLLRVSPIRVTSGSTSVVVVPDESFDLPSGEAIFMTIDLPRLKTVYVKGEVPAGNRPSLWLDTDGLLTELADHGILTSEPDGLLPRTWSGDLPPGQSGVKSVTVDIKRGLRRLAPIAASLVPRHAALVGADSAVTVSGSQPVSLSAKVGSRKTLPRIMMIPYAGPVANECRIIPVTPVGAPARLRIERRSGRDPAHGLPDSRKVRPGLRRRPGHREVPRWRGPVRMGQSVRLPVAHRVLLRTRR